MELSFLFYSQETGRQKTLEKILKTFCKENTLLSPGYAIAKAAEGDAGELFRVNINMTNPWRVNSDMDQETETELLEALTSRLLIQALINKFVPMDLAGNEIYLFPPYGFDVIFYNEKRGKKDALEQVIIRLGQEIPGHDGSFNVREHAPEDEPGEYYYVSILIQDNWNEHGRERLKLAFYFRLLMLAKNLGFQPVILSDSNDKE